MAVPTAPGTDVTPEAEGPPDRIFSRLVYDPVREVSLLIAGERANNFFGDVWAWDGQGWTELPNAELVPRYGHVAAWDSGAEQILLFGGAGPEGDGLNFRFTKTLSLAADGPWEDVSPNTASPELGSTASAWDPVREEVVVFGGLGEFGDRSGDTWIWDGSSWRNATPETSPRGRTHPRMVADEARGNIVLFGGNRSTNYLGDTWIWDGASWVEVTPANSPAGRTRHAMGYDAERETVIMFGGRSDVAYSTAETWEWDGSTWTMLSDGRSRFGASFLVSVGLIPAPEGGLLMLGSRTGDGMTSYEQLWHWDGETWTKRAELGEERAGRQFQPGARDGVRGTLIAFGGRDLNETYDDTWELVDGTWRQLMPAVHPPPSITGAMVWQPNRRKILFYGAGDQTWEWNGAVALPPID